MVPEARVSPKSLDHTKKYKVVHDLDPLNIIISPIWEWIAWVSNMLNPQLGNEILN